MLFQSTDLNNFQSYKQATFPVDDGLTLIDGPNGVGKSSLWDAISWCLFGKTVRGGSVDAVINRKVGKNCMVKSKFKLKGKAYEVVRCRKHDEFQNRLWAVVDGKQIEKGTVDKTQEWLIDELGIDFDLFRCTVLFAQGETFNFINESNGEQKKVLSKIMRVNFQQYQQTAKEAIKALDSKTMDIDKKLAVLKSHLGDPEIKYKEDIKTWESDRAERIEDTKIEMKEIQERIDSCKKKMTGRNLSEIKEKLTVANERLADINGRIDKRSGMASDLKAEIASAGREIAKIEDLIEAKECPTCGSKYESDPDTMAELNKSLAKQRQRLTLLVTNIDELKALRTQVEGSKEHIIEVIREVEQSERQLTQDNKSLRHRKDSLDEIKAETNPFVARIAAEKAKQAEIKTKIKEFEDQIAEIKDKEPYLQFWVKAFGDDGIKSFIFDVICSGLTEKSNKYLNTLTDGSISVRFDTQKALKSGEVREKFSCEVITDGQSVDYAEYSGGEKRRISLAVDMALSELMSDQYGSKFNMICFDEQDTYLDAEGRKSYMKLLRELAKERSVYVVAHDTEFKAQFDHVITIAKERGLSRIT